MTRMGCFVVGILFLGCASPGFTGEKKQRPSEREIKALIAQLVSPNPRPITFEEDRRMAGRYRLPPGFDPKKQRRVDEARDKLRQLGPPAFPLLIAHWGDKRYCLTILTDLGGGWHNRTVGEICRAIVFDQLQPYTFWPEVHGDPRGKPKRPMYPQTFLASQKAARRWWKKHKHATLYQMQRAVLAWVRTEEAKRPRDFTRAERQELRRIRKQLVRGGKPLPPGNYYVEHVEELRFGGPP
jgi:hypothetical protein